MKKVLLWIASIVGGLVVLGFFLATIYVSILSEKKLSLDTTTIVSILLAFFSIFISIMFYFKASETSNKFYNKSFKFMKKQSNLIGQMQVQFGEKFTYFEQMLLGNMEKKKGLDKDYEEMLIQREKIIREYINEVENKDEHLKELEEKLSENDAIISKLRNRSNEVNKKVYNLLSEGSMSHYVKGDSFVYTSSMSELPNYIHEITKEIGLEPDNNLRGLIIQAIGNDGNLYENVIQNYNYWIKNQPQLPKKKAINYIKRKINDYINKLP